jgi:2,5-diamino-6-(ribosylamino)-4(3H)-pyrimidinone 5'-phosphate reductase
MRTLHDGILVGIGTAINDNPQLNSTLKSYCIMYVTIRMLARHLPPAPSGVRRHLPRPMVLDAHLRLPPTCKLLQNYTSGRGRRPWVICLAGMADGSKRKELEAAGARIVEVAGEGGATVFVYGNRLRD